MQFQHRISKHTNHQLPYDNFDISVHTAKYKRTQNFYLSDMTVALIQSSEVLGKWQDFLLQFTTTDFKHNLHILQWNLVVKAFCNVHVSRIVP